MRLASWRIGRHTADDIAPPIDLPSGILHISSPTHPAVAEAIGKHLSGRIQLNAPEFEQLVVRVKAAEERARSAEQLMEEIRRERDELQQALDTRRPQPSPTVLGPLLRQVWETPHRGGGPWGTAAIWEAIAETAIDHIRGLWPLADDEPAFHGPSCTCPRPPQDAAVLEAARRLGPTYVAGSNEEAVTPPATSWAGESPAPGDPTLAQRADAVLEGLAVALGSRAVPASPWDTLPIEFQAIYRAYVDVVINEGWRPPLAGAPALRIPDVAAVLTAHELLADNTCRCGWGARPAGVTAAAIWHAEHVAEYLLAASVLA